MKTTKLFALAASMILLASCSNGGSSSAAPTASSAEEASSSSIRVRPSSSSTEVSRQTEAPLPDTLPTIAGTNVTFVESLRTGGENEAKKNPGNLYEWHGDGGSITGFVYENGEYSFNYSSTWRWYGCQLFYVLPYEEAGDTYTVRLRLYSDIDGDITINGTVYSLVWGWNVITFDVTTAAKDSSIISMQLGVSETNTSLPGSYMKLKDIEVYDAVNTYHKVDFLVGESVVKSIMVREGKTVVAPKVVAPQGKILSGWYDGDTAYSSSAVINAPHSYLAKFEDASSALNVTVKFGEETIAIVPTLSGSPASFDDVVAPFGYAIDGYFLDAAFTTPYNNAAVTEDLTVYAKAHVSPTHYFHEGRLSFEERVGENGEYILEYHDCVYTDAWNIQINFASLPIGEVGTAYSFSFEYTLTGTTSSGTYRVYNLADYGETGALAPTEAFVKATSNYNGGELVEGNYYTIEMGLVRPTDPEGTVVLTIRNPKLAVVA